MSVFCVDEVLSFRPLVLPSRFEGISEEATSLACDIGDAYHEETALAIDRMERADERLLRALTKGEARVSAGTLRSALTFLWALPSEYSLPDVVVEDDGQLGFDWDLGPTRVLSVNVGDGGMLGYSALLGAESTYGKAPFPGTIPETLVRLLVQILGDPTGQSGAGN
jgi:hypothetical protein